MKAIILVGGFGTRLRPLTLKTPKPLLPILNKPFITYQLEILRQAHVTDVVFAAGHNASKWIKMVKKLVPKGVKAHLSIENRPMGTGGAVRLAYETMSKKVSISQNEPIAVFNGDVFLDVDLRKFQSFHRKRKSQGSIALIKVKDARNFGLVKLKNSKSIVRFLEKPKKKMPGMINAGCYLLNAGFIQKIPNRPNSIERDVFPGFRRQFRMFGYPISGYWNDIGTPETYLKAHLDLFRVNNRWTGKRFFRKRRFRKKGWTAQFVTGRRTQINKQTLLMGGVSFGSDVKVGAGCEITDSVLLDGVTVGAGTQIKGAIIGSKTVVGENSTLSPGTILGEGTKLTAFART